MILVSACLIGEKCRYDGKANFVLSVAKLVEEGKAIACCPEILGGLPTPREPAEIISGIGVDVLNRKAQVVTKENGDVTSEFVKGAYQTLAVAQENKVKIAILKERSPSCGSCMIYNGKFNGEKQQGEGVTAALLRQNGIKVFSEENFTEIFD